MANIPETVTFDAGVYQLETTDPVEGGVSGKSNAPHKNLANRTVWLKAQIDAHAIDADPHPQYMTAAETSALIALGGGGGGGGGGIYADDFKSAPITWAVLDNTKQVAHGLGSIPDDFSISLVCTTPQSGYLVGDEVNITETFNNQVGNIWADATNIGVTTFYPFYPNLSGSHKTTGASFNFDTTWAFVFRARKFVSVASVTGTGWVDTTSIRNINGSILYQNTTGSAIVVNLEYDPVVSSGGIWCSPNPLGGGGLPIVTWKAASTTLSATGPDMSAATAVVSGTTFASLVVPNNWYYFIQTPDPNGIVNEMTLGSGTTTLPARTWVNYGSVGGIAGRSFNTVYQNTTGQDIDITVSDSANPGQLFIGSTSSPTTQLGDTGVTIPNGWYYKYYMSTAISVITWYELRA